MHKVLSRSIPLVTVKGMRAISPGTSAVPVSRYSVMARARMGRVAPSG